MAIFGVTSKPFPKLTPRSAASPAQRRLRSGEPGLPRSKTSFPAPSELILAPLPTQAAPCDPATLRHLQSIGVAVGDQLVADKAGGSGDQYTHEVLLFASGCQHYGACFFTDLSPACHAVGLNALRLRSILMTIS